MKLNYPKPTESIEVAKTDLKKWGYCLLKNAIPPDLNSRAMERLIEQANAEKELNLAYEDGSEKKKWGDFNNNTDAPGVNQRVWMLPNKGKVFLDILAKHNYVDCVKEIVGDEFLVSSFGANIAKPGGLKMDLHTDQWWAPEPTKPGRRNLPVGSMTRKKFDCDLGFSGVKSAIAPAACSNVIFMMNDFTDENGGTRLVPGSHMFGRHPDLIKDKDIETVAAEGNSGTALITDGRVWHGTGANATKENRIAMLLTFCGPQYRPQVNYPVALDSAILKSASDRQKALFGLKIWWGYGRTGDPNLDFIDPDGQTLGKLTLS